MSEDEEEDEDNYYEDADFGLIFLTLFPADTILGLDNEDAAGKSRQCPNKQPSSSTFRQHLVSFFLENIMFHFYPFRWVGV